MSDTNPPSPRAPRVAVLGSTYPRSHDDPAVPWQREAVGRTAAAGCEVTVVAPSFRGLRSHRIDGVEVVRFRYAPKRWETLTHDEGAPNKLRSPFFKLLAIPYLVCGFLAMFWLCLTRRFDVVHVHWPFPHGLMAWLPARLTGARIVSTCHGAELAMARNSGAVRRLLRFVLRKSDALVANSSHTANAVRKVAGDDVEIAVLPYGTTLKAPAPKPAAPNDTPLLLNCGRLIERKGLGYLLDALPLVLAEHPVKVVITGEGDCKESWQRKTTEMGLDHAVEWAGFVSNERLAELYATCDLYVHPSIHDSRGDTEGLGVVLVEALQNAKPVVASAVGGIVDVIKNRETGLLVPEKDPRALADAILEVIFDPGLGAQLGAGGLRHARAYFDWDRITARLVDIYRGPTGAAAATLRQTRPSAA